MYQADYMYSIEEAIGIFRNNIRNRKDLSQEFKNKALDLPIGRNQEIVYYPAHIYQTDTTKSWNTTSSSTSRSTYEGWDIKTTTTTTTRHTKGGYKKVSEAKFKSTCYELEVEKLDLNQTSQVNNFKSLAIPMYTENLFFTRAESGKNAIAAGKEASNAGKNDSTHTTWSLHVVLIPILRYEFELCGKKCYFEMNLHNGTYITHYKQKGGCAFAHVMMKLGHVALGALAFLLPLLALITGFSKGFADVGFFKKSYWGCHIRRLCNSRLNLRVNFSPSNIIC